MNEQDQKCVMVLDGELPLGVIANAAAILGISMGKQVPQIAGDDAVDQGGGKHSGIIRTPVPILRGTAQEIAALRQKLCRPGFEDVKTVDFTELAQGCRTYGEYIERMAQTRDENLRYLGLALCGEKKKVNRLTGSMPLLR